MVSSFVTRHNISINCGLWQTRNKIPNICVMCVKTLLTNGDMQKIKEHAGEVWHSYVIESGAHDNFPHSAYGQKQNGYSIPPKYEFVPRGKV